MATAQPAQSLKALQRDFIHGCHILHKTGVLDAFGHLSVRHPDKDGVYIMCRNMAPGTVAKSSDLVEYRVVDAEPVDPKSPTGYLERFIHSEIYKAHPSAKAVIHSHAMEVVPYTMNTVPLLPCYHMGGFLGMQTPIWDIADSCYTGNEVQNMLVVNMQQGASLAASFHDKKRKTGPPHSVVLMRGHGLTLHGSSIPDVVIKAVYAVKNAAVQTTALLTRAAYHSGPSSLVAPDIRYLSEKECEGSVEMMVGSHMRAWNLYVKEVELDQLYTNEA